MKYRRDFVTNSSSSSYICDVCGQVESGWDMDISDAGMFECENGHIICFDEMVRRSKEELLQIAINDYEFSESSIAEMKECDLEDKIFSSDYYEVSKKLCPICSFETIRKKDILSYLLKKYGISNLDEIVKECKEKFKNYQAFQDYLRGNKGNNE